MKRLNCLTTLSLLALTSTIMADNGKQFRKLLISSSENVNEKTWKLTDQDVPTSGKWSVTKKTLKGGRSEGVDLVTVDNGELSIVVIPTRGMSVFDVKSGDVRLGWDSPTTDIVHPQYVNLQSRGGLGWLEGFNEWLVRCGLEFAGHPGKDEFINNTGDKASMDLTLHGKIGNIPASEVEVIVDLIAPYRIRVRGVLYEKFFYGPKLKMVAEISTIPGSNSFQINDVITNLGAFDQEMQMIYHGNYGSPLLEKGARVIVAAKSVAPMNEHAAKAVDKHETFEGPTKGFIEEVYLYEPISDSEGKSMVMIHNAAADRSSTITWSTKELPYLTVWKNTAAAADGYVSGLEPGTGYPFNRRVERKFGRVPKLKSGESIKFGLEYGIQNGEAKVKDAVARVKAIQGGTKLKLIEQAPILD
ncbi:MAG: aldose 1-epimerase family protein [Planctomycetota bacterium]|nr:aldose 1-epimerase family protein [Planctomycetota bacterium]MDA1139698.1 aldose 1-epimerase family protein [Planctomycetota bacterium]